MDIDMPVTNGVEGLKRIKLNFPSVEILMLTVFDDNEHIFECICNGASGYLLKKSSPAKIIDSLRDVCTGGAPMTASIARKVLQMFPKTSAASGDGDSLSPREKDVLFHLVKGLSYKMIANELSIAHDTVRVHIKHIYEKLHVHTMTEAVAKAINERIV
jgi:DNA-binding NarL/FixJ family response regulator